MKFQKNVKIKEIPLVLPEPGQTVFSRAAKMVPGRMVRASMLAVLLSFVGSTAFSGIVYVRDGGNGDGSSWSSALDDLPYPLVRGNTYYVADGAYAGQGWPDRVVDVPVNGTNQIYIKKASVSDHGNDTGWSSAYGDGEAVFGRWYVRNTGYITWDGSYEYGFRINVAAGGGDAFAMRNDNGTIPNLTWKYVKVIGVGEGIERYPWVANGPSRAVRIWGGTGTKCPNWTVSHCYFSGLSDAMYLDQVSNLLVEYTVMAWCHGESSSHPNVVYIENSSNCTWRYNIMREFNCNGFEIGGASNWKVYGNLCYNSPSTTREVSRFTEHHFKAFVSNIQYYNNTIVNMGLNVFNCEPNMGSGHVAMNNIFYNNASIGSLVGGSMDYNWYSGSSAGGEPHGIAGGSSQPFVNYAAQNFNIVGAIGNALPRNKGVALAAEFASDYYSTSRQSDGVWDVGAYEYGGGAGTNPVISISPSSLDFGVIAAGKTNDLTITVRNVGLGMLSGVASVPAPFTVVSGATYSLGSNQSQIVTISYRPMAPGDHTTNITFTGGGGAVLLASGVAFSALSGLSFGADAGIVSSPFVSNGGVISQPINSGVTDGGRAVYAFTIADAGDYVVQAIVEAPSAAENSLYLNVDAEPADPFMTWHVPVGSGFQTLLVSWQGNGTFDQPETPRKVFRLSAGTHQLIVRGREANTKVQHLSIVKEIAAPSNLRVVSSR